MLNRVHPTTREAWDALQPVVTAGTLFFLADEARPGWRDDYDADQEAKMAAANNAAAFREEMFGATKEAKTDAPPNCKSATTEMRGEQTEDAGTHKSSFQKAIDDPIEVDVGDAPLDPITGAASAKELLAKFSKTLSAMKDVTRHTGYLKNVAFVMGRYVGADLITEEEVKSALREAALASGMLAEKVDDVLKRAINRGRRKPITAEDLAPPEYTAHPDGTYWYKPAKGGHERVRLADFSAKIIEDVRLDDGSGETQRMFALEGSLGRAQRAGQDLQRHALGPRCSGVCEPISRRGRAARSTSPTPSRSSVMRVRSRSTLTPDGARSASAGSTFMVAKASAPRSGSTGRSPATRCRR